MTWSIGERFDDLKTEGLPLTQEEVSRLPNGARVIIIWSGGNGPHTYVVKVNKYGVRDAWTDFANGYNASAGILHYCGFYPLTQVWRAPAEHATPDASPARG